MSVGIFLSPVSLALVFVLLLVPSTKVLGYFRNVRFADSNPLVAMTATQDKQSKADEIKVLAAGFHSSITHPFVAVVRDAETYAALVKLDGNLPRLDEEFFKTNVVVAAFLGERNTGGYSVEIARCDGRICVDERSPGKGVMVPQVITSPFKLLSAPARGTRPLSLLLHSPWWQSMRPYRVTAGNFIMSGGFAGTTKQFGLEGQVWVIRQNSFVTFAFEIFSHELTENRSLVGFETGVIRSKGDIAILRMTADSLADSPNSGLKATAVFSEADNKLSLNFLPLPSMIADGYSGRGNIEAMIIAPAPKPGSVKDTEPCSR